MTTSSFEPRLGKALPRKNPAETSTPTQSAAPTALHSQNFTRFISLTPATNVTYVRTNGTKRPITRAELPCFSKNSTVRSM